VVVNTEDKALDMPAGRARVDDLTAMPGGVNASAGGALLEALLFSSRAEQSFDHALAELQQQQQGGSTSKNAPSSLASRLVAPPRVRGWLGPPHECKQLTTSPGFVRPWEAAAAPLPKRRPNDEGGRMVALTSFGEPLGPYMFHSALFGPSTLLESAKHTGGKAVKLVVADPPNGCNVQEYKARQCGGSCLMIIVFTPDNCLEKNNNKQKKNNNNNNNNTTTTTTTTTTNRSA
jgi:hypothetical protein